MSINITSKGTIPKVNLTKLQIDQLLIRIDRETRAKMLNGTAVAYGVNPDGSLTFSPTIMSIDETDFDTAAVAWAIANGQAVDAADAVAKLAQAKLDIAALNPDIFTLMAYFEQGAGLIFEVLNKVTGVGIE